MSSNIYDSASFRLFKKMPSFIDGAVAMLDFSKNENRYHIDTTVKEADSNAIMADWVAIGKDMSAAIELYAKESNSTATATK